MYRLVVLSILLSTNAFSKPSVNILSWWDYINSEEIIKLVENKCNVDVSIDEFYSNDEFSRRVRKSDYDVIVHSEAAYSSVKDLIVKSDSSFAKEHVENYHPLIKKRYDDSEFKYNTAYLAMYLTVLLWDKDQITIEGHDDIKDILYKSREKYVVLTDDQYEISHIFKSLTGSKTWSIPNYDAVSRYFYRTKFIATNLIGSLVKHKDFAVAYTWSGSALGALSANPDKKLEIMVHPKLSHASADMISVLNNKKGSSCVAKVLSSKKVIETTQTTMSHYFSPYGKITSRKVSENYTYIEKEFFKRLKYSNWLPDFSKENAINLNHNWQRVKVELGIQL